MSVSPLDVEKCRAQFPSLNSGYIFAENAGGSQCLRSVVDRVSDYLLNTNVQLGADYSVSITSTNRVSSGAEVTATFINAASANEIIFGPSSTMLMENLSRAIDKDCLDGEEFIITDVDHEANAGPWKKLAARRNLIVRRWLPSLISPNLDNPYAVTLALPHLLPLINSKTRIVAFTACSNVLGELVDVKGIVKAIREKAKEVGARKVEICIDCVAYAPHRRINVRDWDVDYCFFSYYKVYGPHTSVLYARQASLTSSLSSLAHFFLASHESSTSYKMLVGGPGYELTYASTAVVPYLASLGGGDTTDISAALDRAFVAIAEHEQALIRPLLAFLTSKENKDRGVRIVGPEESGADKRVPTISFAVVGPRAIKSKDVVAVFDKKGNIGIRYGHYYAYNLITGLGLDPNDATVRISLVHYNTEQEVKRIIEILKEVLV